MKKLISIILCLSLCIALAGTSLAVDAETAQEQPSTESVQSESIADAFGSMLPENNDPQLQNTIAALSTVATYIYNYATQPEEPAIDLETLLMILSVVVTVVYTVYNSQIVS